MADEFSFDVPEDAIDNDLYEPERESYPGIAYFSTLRGDDQTGFFVVDKKSVEQRPLPFWQEETMRRRPGQEPDVVYKTTRLRLCPIAWRRRIIIDGDDGGIHKYPFFTPKDEREPGRYKAHYQILSMLPGLDSPVVLGLKGATKTISWDNNPGSGRYFDDRFGPGVWQELLKYTRRASEQKGVAIPALCFWWVDLVPAGANGKPLLIEMGGSSTTVVNPFAIDMRTNREDKRLQLETRYVGKETFLQFQELRKEVGVSWEKEWEDAEALAEETSAPSNGDGYGAGDDYEEEAVYEDDIPF